MRIHIGCEMSFDFPQATPLIAMLNVHYSRASDLERPDFLISNPPVPIESYRDSFGNWCNRLVAPQGRFTFGTDSVIRDPGTFESGDLFAFQHEVQHLPAETLLFLLPSRFCESDVLAIRGLAAVWPHALGRAARAGGVRFRPQPHRVQLWIGPADADGCRSLQ